MTIILLGVRSACLKTQIMALSFHDETVGFRFTFCPGFGDGVVNEGNAFKQYLANVSAHLSLQCAKKKV